MIYSGLDLSCASKEGYVYAVYKTGVEFGIWNGSDLPWGSEHKEEDLLELHIFDADSEYRAVRSVRGEKGFIVKVITDDSMKSKVYDNKSVSTQTLETRMLLFGEEWKDSGDGYYIAEESGREKKIYLDKSKEDFEKGIFIQVTDYYDFDENMLMYLSGYRMTGVTVGEG